MRSGSSATTRGSSSARGTGPNASRSIWGRFHRNRIDIVSSQVSTISPELRGRWDRDRRMDAALDRLDWIPADELITHRIPFERAPEAYELLDSAPDDAVQVILEYE